MVKQRPSDKAEKERFNLQTINIYPKTWNTQEGIDDTMGAPRHTITDIIK